MKIFNIDLHISVIADIKNVLESMGHSVMSWSLSNSTAIMGQKKAAVDGIKNEAGHPETWHNIGPEMGDRFYERYKDELAGYDAFLVTYAPSLASCSRGSTSRSSSWPRFVMKCRSRTIRRGGWSSTDFSASGTTPAG